MKTVNDSNPLTNPFHSIDDKDWVTKVEMRYEREDMIREYVRRGDTKNALEYWFSSISPSSEFSYLMPENPLELARRSCRIHNVTLRVAARLGGLQPLYLHNISEKFGLIISNIHDIHYLDYEMIPLMIREYSDAVANFSTSSYGKLINHAVHYITLHIIEKIDLNEMAASLYVSRDHLSRYFKKETGKTIPEYINHQRIEMAKVLLLDGRADITDIAIRLGYHDSSYFSKVFKQITGAAPKQYRLIHKKQAGNQH